MTSQENFRVWSITKLAEKRLTVTALARKLGLSRYAVSTAINHESMRPKVKARIRVALTKKESV